MVTSSCFSHSSQWWNQRYVKWRHRRKSWKRYIVVDFQEGADFCSLDVPHYSPPRNWEFWEADKPFTKNYLSNHRYREIQAMKRRSIETQKKAGKWEPSGDPFLAKFPNIDRECTDCFWDDGSVREPCSLSIRPGKSGASVYLSDPENSAGINTAGSDVNDAMEKLEAYLATGSPTWRPWQNKKKR